MERFQNFVLDMFDATAPTSIEHMAFHFTLQAIERGEDMTAYLADNQHHTMPELLEPFAVLLQHWQEVS